MPLGFSPALCHFLFFNHGSAQAPGACLGLLSSRPWGDGCCQVKIMGRWASLGGHKGPGYKFRGLWAALRV